ncbi:MAG: hypothetical protein ABSG95_02485 [Solirubrobacteraceae bacterium]|jgi:hypothetical protein
MSDASSVAKNLRDRFSGSTEERFGKVLSELLENPLLTAAIGRAFEAREKAAQAQELAMGALNLPSAADIERLTRRLRAVSHRLEGIEDGVGRLDRALAHDGVEARLAAIEEQLRLMTERLALAPERSSMRSPAATPSSAASVAGTPVAGAPVAGASGAAGEGRAGKPSTSKPSA